MTEYEYVALKVDQRSGAKPFYILSSPASEIVKWSDVPRKKAEYMVGYQRELDKKRFPKITEFLNQDDSNIMPGSVLIAMKENYINITPIDEESNLYKLKITVNSDHDLRGIIFSELYSRLDENEKNYVDSFQQQDLKTVEENSEEDEEDEDTEVQPDSYLSSLVAELKCFDDLSSKRQKEINDYIKSISKPGLILDGQHRVYGAKNAQDSINLPIVILPGMDSSEQVFHFFVINNKAKPIKPTELRAVVSTSLSKKEIDSLYSRFKLAGVLAEEAQWTHQINTDQRSPFKGLINFGLEQDKGIIPENVMYQVVKKFIKPNSKYNTNFNLVEEWKNDSGNYEYRLNMFFAFWNAIKNKYSQAWENALSTSNKQLLQKVTMLVLQEILFNKIDSAMPIYIDNGLTLPFENEEALSSQINMHLKDLPEEFFIREWTEKGLDTSTGQQLLRDQIEKAIWKKGQKIGQLLLFRAKK
jgi:DGQHR domain-containing protein